MRALLAMMKGWIGIVRGGVAIWLEHNPFVHAGSLAFFTLFSLAPTLIIAVTVIGVVLGQSAAQGEIVAQLQDTMGIEAAAAVEQAVLMSRVEATGLMPTLLGIAAILIGATTVFAQLRYSLNVLWGVRPNPGRSGLWRLAKGRVLGLFVVLLIGLGLLLYFVSAIGLQTLAASLDPSMLPPDLSQDDLLGGARWLVAIVIGALFIATLFKVLPDVVVTWQDVLPGALATSLMLSGGRYGIATYLSKTAITSTYGAAASVLIVLFWVYFSALILLLGAALTRAHLTARGRPVIPRGSAVQVVQELI